MSATASGKCPARHTGPVLTLALLLLFASQLTIASPSREHLLAMEGEDAILLETSDDVVVAIVRAYEGGGSTNGNPPRLLLDVREVWRGGREVDRRHAVWVPFPNDIDWEGAGSDEMIKRWEQEPLKAPKLGVKLILVGEVVDQGQGLRFLVSPLGRFEIRRASWVKETLQRGPELQQERAQFGHAWTREFSQADLLEGSRSVLDDTVLEPGQPVLLMWAMLWRGRVVALLPDGRVRVRPEGEDSRWDRDETRDRLRLYSERVLATQSAPTDTSGR